MSGMKPQYKWSIDGVSIVIEAEATILITAKLERSPMVLQANVRTSRATTQLMSSIPVGIILRLSLGRGCCSRC
jgi:hypothetical protein